jgi:RND family efflux transporter MFP subunit
VTGYLKAVHFKDGTDVPKDAPLFEIDPQTYQSEYDRAKAAVTQAEAHRGRLERDFRRVALVPDRGSVTQEEVDKIAGDLAEARAAVGIALAQRELARQNVEFTKIRAPFSGRIGKRMIDPSNLVKANDTILATLVSLNPIYATFDLDEQTLLRLRRLVREGKITSARNEAVAVHIGLADEEGYSLTGVIEFIDNKVEAGTGTLRVRAQVDNDKLLLSPGMFVRIRLPVGKPKPSLVIPEEALGSDQGQRYVYVLNDKDEVVYRAVKLGPQVERLRVIEEGVKADDRVIVSGLQRVRPGVKVVAKEMTKTQ